MNFIIEVPIYPAEVMISIAQEKEQLARSIKRWPKLSKRNQVYLLDDVEKGMDKKKYGGGVYRSPNTGIILMQMPEMIKTPMHHGDLAHEIFHVVEEIADFIELTHSNESSEAWAYLISYLTEAIYKRIKV